MLCFTCFNLFSAEIQEFQRSCLVPYPFFSKSFNKVGTPNKFRTSRQIRDTYSWDFIKLQWRCSCNNSSMFWISVIISHFLTKALILLLRQKMTWGLPYFDQFTSVLPQSKVSKWYRGWGKQCKPWLKEAVWFWAYNICSDLSVPKLRI